MNNDHRFHQWFALSAILLARTAYAIAQQKPIKTLDPVAVSSSRSEQLRFDAPAAIDSEPIDGFRTASPLVNPS
jgi:iron complex outermembrane receptor protein